MLAITKNLTRYDVNYGNLCLIRLKRHHAASLRDLNLVTASISSSIQDVQELHALSPPSAGRYALGLIGTTSYSPLNSAQSNQYVLRSGFQFKDRN